MYKHNRSYGSLSKDLRPGGANFMACVIKGVSFISIIIDFEYHDTIYLFFVQFFCSCQSHQS